jgi:hypothetical protein
MSQKDYEPARVFSFRRFVRVRRACSTIRCGWLVNITIILPLDIRILSFGYRRRGYHLRDEFRLKGVNLGDEQQQ